LGFQDARVADGVTELRSGAGEVTVLIRTSAAATETIMSDAFQFLGRIRAAMFSPPTEAHGARTWMSRMFTLAHT
jgi:hypothetical protein